MRTQFLSRFVPALVVVGLSACSSGHHGHTEDANVSSGEVGEAGPFDFGMKADGGPDSPLVSCEPKICGLGQRCEDTPDGKSCVDKECADLDCGDTGECAPAPGGGNYCKSIACTSDVQCSAARHCDGSVCVDDVCEANTQRCEDNQAFQCASNGGSDVAQPVCRAGAYFRSTCDQAASGAAGCTCEDDWDCPSFTACNAGICQGSRMSPTCTLPPLSFENTLPTLEFRWGGSAADDKLAVGRPFPNYSQVSMTPVVANLDDDNGDGLIDEFDFPEIIFMTYAGVDQGVKHSGAVRAVHGGGPGRGRDYFALCGAKHWFQGDATDSATCEVEEGVTRPGGGLAVGDLDYDGVPEIVVPTEHGTLQFLDNRGRLLSESPKHFPAYDDPAPDNNAWVYPQLALANLDNSGLVEVILGNLVFTLEKSAGAIRVRDTFAGPPSVPGEQPAQGAQDDENRHFGPTACPANVVDTDPDDDDVSQEIVVGTVLYALPAPPPGVTRRADCAAADASDFCAGRLKVVWDARIVNSTDLSQGVPYREGFCAVADVLSANGAAPSSDRPLDQVPEVVLVSNGLVLVLRADTGQLLRRIDVEQGNRGGPPNVDDFDGDGFPEIAMASSTFYAVVDLQEPDATSCPVWTESLGPSAPAPGGNPARNPGGSCSSDADCNSGSVCNTVVGACVCLHNSWRRVTEDDSSRATSSSVFDFNGDGAAEVVYGDECYFRAYDGATGQVRVAIPSVSRTGLENPLVADVDNDGNAEIVFVNNNEYLRCDQELLTAPDGSTVRPSALPNGIQVWGDASDTWVSARRIWNQHAYHVTNVGENGRIPLREPESWKSFGGRHYNTYRSQPRSAGIAPDLTLPAMQVSSPDVACGQLTGTLQIVVLVANRGDLRVGPGVELSFYGDFGSGFEKLQNEDGKALTATLEDSLEPGASLLVTVPYTVDTAAPTRIAAQVDEGQSERECHEDNNRIEYDVSGIQELADLELQIGAATDACDNLEVDVTVRNLGSVEARNVLVRLYAGNPSSGAQAIGETLIPSAIAPGESVDAKVAADSAIFRDITIYGVADPLGAIDECNSANNLAEGPTASCATVLF